uniref:Protein kinase domain-containing protein n=1 Tax=Neobodo designis TaxID=312471 RepID=A0A7S1M2K0_NEODS|mmetsp:Transcript_32986/g.101883  ORF Transcript_32986/g.101883 Transcript_32986/m.101883 type:complete len:694 (+) Transcript_32986:29-2110(+)
MERNTPPPSRASTGQQKPAVHSRLVTIANSVVASTFAAGTGPNSPQVAGGSPNTGNFAPPVPALEAEIERVTNGLDRHSLQRLCILFAREAAVGRDEMAESELASIRTPRYLGDDGGPKLDHRRRTMAQPNQSSEPAGLSNFVSIPAMAAPRGTDSLQSGNSSTESAELMPVVAIEAELDEDVEEGDRSRSPQAFSLTPGTASAAGLGAPVDRFALSTSAMVQHDGTGEVEQVNSLLFFEQLGEGATGSVWHCVDEESGDERAVKIIPRAKLSSASPMIGETSAPSLIDEVNFMRGLQHRHIVRLHELIDDSARDEVFIVMDFIKGGTVASLNVKTGECPRLRPTDVSVIAFQIGSALYHCHKLGFTHGDVKPDNILCDTELQPILEPVPHHNASTTMDESNVSFMTDSPGSRFASPCGGDISTTNSPSKQAPFTCYLADFGVAAAVSGQRQCRRQSLGGVLSHNDPDARSELPPAPLRNLAGSPARWTPRTSQSPQPLLTPQRAASALLPQPPAEPPSMAGGNNSARNGQFTPSESPAISGTSCASRQRRESQSSAGASVAAVTFDMDDDEDYEEELRRRSNVGTKAVAVQGTTPVLEAPERLAGGERTPATDMWALGVTLYALLFGRVPFFASTYGELRQKVLREDPAWPPETANGTYARWRRVLAEMLHKDPARRLTATELRRRRVARPM